MKKVCMVVPSFTAKGGIASVVCGYKNSALANDYDIHYIETYCEGSKVQKLLKGVVAYFKFAKELMIWKPDIVHIHSSFGTSFYRKKPIITMASLAKIPIVNHIHGAEFEKFYQNRGLKRKEKIKKVYDRCRYLVALSEEWKNNLGKIVEIEKVIIVENYSTLYENLVIERQNRNPNNEVLFMGFINKRKGCYDIPYVVKKVSQVIPEVKFILAGSGDITNIKELLRKENVLDFVEFPGWIRGKEKDEAIRHADIFFLPSYNEGMPMAILDAMGYGMPIVSTRVGGIAEIVHHEENGFIFEPGDTEGFSNAIIELLKDKCFLAKASQYSWEIAREKYSLSRHLLNISDIYRKVI